MGSQGVEGPRGFIGMPGHHGSPGKNGVQGQPGERGPQVKLFVICLDVNNFKNKFYNKQILLIIVASEPLSNLGFLIIR